MSPSIGLPPIPFTSLEDSELRRLIAEGERRIAEALAPYEPISATLAWFDTLRAIEECINFLTFEWEDEDLELSLYGLPVLGVLTDHARLASVRSSLAAQFGENFAIRFTQLLIRGASIETAFAAYGLTEVAACFVTVGSMIGYLMSRRRHFVALLHALPLLCRGRQVVVPLDTFKLFLPTVELQGLPLVGAHQARLINASRQKLGLDAATPLGLVMLDPMFLEPERSRITEVPLTDAGWQMLDAREPLASDRLFSAAELRNDIVAMEAAYAEFDLAGTEFESAAVLVRRLSRDFADRDFWIVIQPDALEALSRELRLSIALRAALIHSSPSYMGCLSTYAPLVLVGGVYRSTVTLLSRFMYYWRAVSLDRRKRYQIRAGFIFEQAVAHELAKQGFAIQDITRINRHEFDVVTVRDGTVWNVQCKNNFLDLERLAADPPRFAKYNRNLVRSYERALSKERDREHVLAARLSTDDVRHMVVSRFPVVTDNPRIVPFSRIGQFEAITKALNQSAGGALGN